MAEFQDGYKQAKVIYKDVVYKVAEENQVQASLVGRKDQMNQCLLYVGGR